jgi:hypothetical protein
MAPRLAGKVAHTSSTGNRPVLKRDRARELCLSVKKLLVVRRKEPEESGGGSLWSWALAQAVLSQSFVLGRLSCLRGVVGMMHSVLGGDEALSSS